MLFRSKTDGDHFRSRSGGDEIAFVATGSGTEVVAISLWDKKEDAEAYHRGSYPEVLKALAKVVDGTPEVRNFEVANSTLQKTATRVAA